MQLITTYTRLAAGGTGLSDPGDPLHLAAAYKIIHPDGLAWRTVDLGPVTCLSRESQPIMLSVWSYDGVMWRLQWDNVLLRAQTDILTRGDSIVLTLESGTRAHPGVATGVSVLPRHSLVVNGTYTFNFSASDTARCPC